MSHGATTPPFDFVPAAPKSLSDCDQLFGPDTAAAAFYLSAEYYDSFSAFETAVNESTLDEEIEGYTFQQPMQFKVLHYLASRPNVHNICETGFNLGHSSFNYLTANRHAIVHSFDLGIHQYCRQAPRAGRQDERCEWERVGCVSDNTVYLQRIASLLMTFNMRIGRTRSQRSFSRFITMSPLHQDSAALVSRGTSQHDATPAGRLSARERNTMTRKRRRIRLRTLHIPVTVLYTPTATSRQPKDQNIAEWR